MTAKRRKSWFLAAVGLAISVALVYYGYWVHLVREANMTLRQEQDAVLATSQYQKAVAWTPPLVSAIPGLREPLREALLKQGQLLFVQQKSEEALAYIQVLPSEYPFLARDWEYHLWYGNALFQRAILQEDAQVLVNDLRGAVREYQSALELNPASWDARYNYEFIKQALMAEGEAGAQQLKLLLEEKPREDREERVPPEKVG
jgi:tetratricopeptide (TPR) repeat protein